MDSQANNEWNAFLIKSSELLEKRLKDQTIYVNNNETIIHMFEKAKIEISTMSDEWLKIDNSSWIRESPKINKIQKLTSDKIIAFLKFLEEEQQKIKEIILIYRSINNADKTLFESHYKSFADHCNVIKEQIKSNLQTRSSNRLNDLKKEKSDICHKRIPIYISIGALIIAGLTFVYNYKNSSNNSKIIIDNSDKILDINERLKLIENKSTVNNKVIKK